MLPAEVKRQARFLKLKEKDFIEKYCILHLQLFPTEYRENTLEVFNELVPKIISEKIKLHLGYLPNYFLILPILAFKRIKGKCIFFNGKNNSCRIYVARPKQCSFFPFISLKEEPDFLREYQFCKGLKSKGKMGKHQNLGEEHYKEIKKYFNSVKEKGFTKVWCFYPKKGIALYRDKKISDISTKEFFQCIEPFI